MRGAGNGPVSGTVLLHTPHRHIWGKFKRGGGAWAYHGCRVMSRIILRVRGLVERRRSAPAGPFRYPIRLPIPDHPTPSAARDACAFAIPRERPDACAPREVRLRTE
jgi:hypothetical protein